MQIHALHVVASHEAFAGTMALAMAQIFILLCSMQQKFEPYLVKSVTNP